MVFNSFDSMPLLLNVNDIADTLSIGKNAAYSLVSSGQITSIRIGQQYRILRDDFIKFLKEGSTKSEA